MLYFSYQKNLKREDGTMANNGGTKLVNNL